MPRRSSTAVLVAGDDQAVTAADDALRLLVELGFTVNEARVYPALLRLANPTAAEVASAAGVPRPKVYEALQVLEGRGFSKSIGGRVRTYAAVAPEVALASWLSYREQQRREMGEQDQRRAELLSTLLPASRPSSLSPQVPDFVEAISGQLPTSHALDDLIRRARQRLDIMLQPPYLQARQRWNVMEVDALGRGVHIRALYAPEALTERRRFESIRGGGGEVRCLSPLPMKLMIRDGEEALVSLRDADTGAQSVTTVAIRHPDLVAPLTTVFDDAWRRAEPLPDHAETT